MQRTPWLNVLIILLVLIAGFYLAQLVWQLLSGFSDIILLFALAWFIAFALSPIVGRLTDKSLPQCLLAVTRRWSNALGGRVERFHSPRLLAVSVVYLGVAVLLILLLFQFVPPALVQLNQLVRQLPEFANRTPELARLAQDFMARFGIRLNVEAALARGLDSIQSLATPVLQNAVVILTSILALLGNLLLVLILSFLFALDGPRLWRTVFAMIPAQFADEFQVLSVTIDRTFGGFIRAQLLQALLVGGGTAMVMTLWDAEFVLVTSLFAGLFMLIPFVGPVLALTPPVLVMLLSQPDRTVWILVILLVYQLLITNVIMPKILSDVLGLHPLVVIAALLLGIKVGGFWGAFFGVPVAGVLAAMALFFYRRVDWRTVGNRVVAPTPGSASTAAPPPADEMEKKNA